MLDGCQVFQLDPLTALISQYSTSEANERLNSLMSDMADLVSQYPITIVAYSHVNPKAKGNTPHELGAPVLSSEFTGSRAQERWSHVGIGIRRNRAPDCPEHLKDVCFLDVLYDRFKGASATQCTKYEVETGQLLPHVVEEPEEETQQGGIKRQAAKVDPW